MVRFLAVLSLYFCALAASAEQAVQVYRAEALVASQSVAERNAAMRVSLGEVIVRVSGDSAALEHPNVRQALNKAQTYLYEFSYASTDEYLDVEGKQVRATRLLLKFSPPAIEKLLRDSRLSLWPANRPKLLVWLVMRDEAGVMHRVPDDEVREALYQQAALRGLPLLMPMHDLEDNLALSADNLWTKDESAIKEASERYNPDAILVGRYSRTGDGSWRASWSLVHSSGNQSFDTQSAEMSGLFTQAIDTSANYFAQLYAITPSEQGPGNIVIRINDVRNFSTYKKVERYLQGLGVITRVDLMAAENDRLLLRLHTEGGMALLLSTLELGKKLYPVMSESLPVLNVSAHRPGANNDQTAPAPVQEMPAISTDGSAVNNVTQTRGTAANPLIYRWQN